MRCRIGVTVVAAERGEMTAAFDTVNHSFPLSEMTAPNSSYWSSPFGMERRDVDKDQDG